MLLLIRNINTLCQYVSLNLCSIFFNIQQIVYSYQAIWVEVGSSKLVVTFNLVGGPFNLLSTTAWYVSMIFSNMGLYAACWARSMRHGSLEPKTLWSRTEAQRLRNAATTEADILTFIACWHQRLLTSLIVPLIYHGQPMLVWFPPLYLCYTPLCQRGKRTSTHALQIQPAWPSLIRLVPRGHWLYRIDRFSASSGKYFNNLCHLILKTTMSNFLWFSTPRIN